MRPAAAQTDLVFRETPLADALYLFSERTGVEVVFAVRLVGDLRVSGRYGADDPDRALRLMLRGTGVRAERIRAGQYVLIAVPLNVGVGDDDGRQAYTGTLDGRVVDGETGAPLPGAHVWLVDLGLGGVVADDGAFAVPDLPTGRYTVRVSHVGYRAVRLDLDVFPDSPRLPPTVRLQPEPVASGGADVRAGPADVGPAPGTIDLDARQAAALPVVFAEGDLAAALSYLPGLTRTGGASGPIAVRGADPYQARTLRDGVPVLDPWHAFGLLSAFQPEALSRVRLHRGTLPAALGGGLAAVLDAETTDALAGDTLVTAAVSPLAARLVADLALGRAVGLHVGLRQSTLGLAVSPSVGLVGDPAGLVVLDAAGTPGPDGAGTVAFGDAEAKVSVRLGGRLRLDVGGTLGRDVVRLDLPTGAGAPGALDYAWRSAGASARVRGLVGQRTFVTTVAYRATHATDEQRTDRPRTTVEALGETGLTLDVDHYRSTRHQIQGGLQVAIRSLDATTPADTSRQRGAEVDLYLADTWAPSKLWQVQPGLRAELITAQTGPARLVLSPRLAVRWTSADDRVVVRAGAGRQTQALQRLRLRAGDRYEGAAARWLLTSRRVPLASAWQAGAGAEWAVTRRVAVSVDLYGRRSSGLLEAPPGPLAEPGVGVDALLAQFAVHDGRAAGVEAAARLDVGAWTLGLTGTAARARVRPTRRDGPWRASRYDRPLGAGLLAERRGRVFSVALRIDAESGLAGADGMRAAADLRVGAAAGARTMWRGVEWQALAQATARPLATEGGDWRGAATGLPLVVDAGALPGLPLLSLTARW